MAIILFLTATLIFSCGGMLALLTIKNWELSTGRVLFADLRLRASMLSHRFIEFFEYRVPGVVRLMFNKILYWLRGSARAALAEVLLSIEHSLERVLHFLRHGLVKRQDTESQVSAFLQEVAEHKKRLVRNSRERRALGRISE